MKIKKKAAIAAVLFSAAVNFSACAYGPPPDEYENVNNNDTVSQTDAENGSDDAGTESENGDDKE